MSSSSLVVEINKKRKTEPVQIPSNNCKREFDLSTELFDPEHNSPPNEFMRKLNQRIRVFGSSNLSSPIIKDSRRMII